MSEPKVTYTVPSRINDVMDRKRQVDAAIITLHEDYHLTPRELIDLFGHRAQKVLDDQYAEIFERTSTETS